MKDEKLKYGEKEPAGEEERAKKRKQKKSKRKRHSSPSNNEDLVVGETDVSPRKKKKAKKSRDVADKDQESNVEESLEGSLVDGEIVLIDRKSGKVYSGLERGENGGRKEIGKASESGSIDLYKSEKGTVKNTEENAEIEKPEFPFETDADDHCESPLQAYKDIVPFLKDFNERKASTGELCIYDPYFCNGAVIENFNSLGFSKVYNRKEDCYKVWGTSSYPSHDLLVTNPPYSGDHIEKLIDHVTSKSFGNRPFLLLMPQWVHKKDYYISKTKGIRPFFVVPRKRYIYLPPPSFRKSKKSDVHKKSSPFVSMWFVWGGTTQQNERWLSAISKRITDCDIARSKSALRDLRRKGNMKK
ncbi:unnamed protein product [Cylindrotheca closterium]|uniref:Uncharacterized protein n=1 Tax=Cylindrotheca closterium TaxID=2856 RepID=A0AAD2GA83_9STRA|nr:unnamed protein product [Cylindrotheca closterium]